MPCSRAAVYRDQRAVYRPGSGAHRPCLPVRQTQGQPEAQAYREQQLVKLKKYRLGLAPGPQADGVDALIQEMEDGLWP